VALVIVCGLGEIGKPLYNILRRTYDTRGVDVQPQEFDSPCSVLHICYPFQIPDFLGETVRYIEKYRPGLVIINGTVVPGITRQVHEASGGQPVAYSPVRGKHAKMEQDMLFYRKFVAGVDDTSTQVAEKHFADAGFRTDRFPNLESGELAKLLETTYLGVLVGWAQEVERIAARYGANFDDVNSFVREVAFLPSQVFPGVIGGHCVMPNIALLQSQIQSKFLDAIAESNEQKKSVMAAGGAPR